jgi:hypothetical protein
MNHPFSYRMLGTPDRWALYYGEPQVGEVFWIATLDHPTVALDRITAGLNCQHPYPDGLRWAAVESSPGRWDLLEVGNMVGELAWTHPRMLEKPTRKWTRRALDGLNDDPEFCTHAPQEPAA